MLQPQFYTPLPASETASIPPPTADANILAIHRYWQRLTPPDRTLPGRQHLNPADIKPLLPHIWIIDVIGDPARFRYRLIGTKFHSHGSRMKPGDFIDEFLDPAGKASVLGYFNQVLHTRAPLWHRGRGYTPSAKKAFELETMILPMAGDGEQVDMLLGLSIYYTSTGDTH